jgi:hypothetical protein
VIDRQTHIPDYAPALASQDREEREAREARETMWAFLWILFVFKAITLGVLFFYTDSPEVKHLIGMTSWPWLLIPGVAIAGLIAYRKRLVIARRRRERLRKAEWMIDERTAAK